jgi:hypothetical protein
MTSPRWTYSEANASRWRTTFDSLISGEQRELTIPLAGNARSLCSLKIRVGDALKWLADQFTSHGNPAFKPYAELKPLLRFVGSECRLVVQVKPPRLISHQSTHEPERPINLDAATIRRMIALSNDPNQTEDVRKRFAATVERELLLRSNDPALAAFSF